MLPDGRIIIADEKVGLRLLRSDGSSRPFGNMDKAGFRQEPPAVVAAPNGIHLESDGRHLLVSDVYRGAIYRTDTRSESTELIYEHSKGVNVAIRDKNGNIWFSQSADNPRPRGHETLYTAIDKAIASGSVFFLRMKGDEPEGNAVEVASGLFFANGVGFSRDYETLYVSETMANRVLAFDADLEKGKLSDPKVLGLVMTPDNLDIDEDGNVWVVSPLTNSVVVIDSRCGAVQEVFSARSESNSATSRKWAQTALERGSLMTLFTPEAWKPLPGGFITGLFRSSNGKTLYITGLGTAILKYDLP